MSAAGVPWWRRPAWLALGLAVVALVVGGGLVVTGDSGGGEGSSTDGLDESDTTFSADLAGEFEVALESRDPEALGRVLLVEDPADLGEIAQRALPPGTSIEIDATTFEPQDDGTAVVEAELLGDRRAVVTLFLLFQDDRWVMIGSTAPEGT